MVNEARKEATNYYDKKKEMAAFIENAISDHARSRSYLYYNVSRFTGLSQKHVDECLSHMIGAGVAKETPEGLVVKRRGGQ